MVLLLHAITAAIFFAACGLCITALIDHLVNGHAGAREVSQWQPSVIASFVMLACFGSSTHGCSL